MKKINIADKFGLFHDLWNPKIVTQLNGQDIRLVKVQGELFSHAHEHEDELFLVLKGQLILCFETEDVLLKEGEMLVVPKGLQHKPKAEKECWLLLFEPSRTKHTGNQLREETITQLDRI